MDLDALREATERWVDADVIDAETAAAIQEFERGRGNGEEPGDREDWLGEIGVENRLAVALSVMGVVLVGAGLLVYLRANWESLSVAARTAVLFAAPPAAGTAGVALRRRGLPRVGGACLFLGAALLGPSLFLLGDLHVPELDTAWLLLGWAAVALPVGHASDSRLTTALGLVVALAAAGDATQPPDGAPFVVAFLGAVTVAAGLALGRQSGRLAGVYRIVGLVPVAGFLLVLGFREGDYRTLTLGADPALVASAAVAGLAVLAAAAGWHRGRVGGSDATAVIAPGLAAGLGLVAVAVTPPLPGLASFLFVHATLLGLLVAVVAVAVAARSRALVNLVALAFFLQVTTFLVVTVGETLPGALALVVAGGLLLAVGLALERGRRELLARMNVR